MKLNPRLSVGVAKAIEKVQRGVPVRKAAADSGVWPQAVYLALKREGIEPPAAKSEDDKKAVAK